MPTGASRPWASQVTGSPTEGTRTAATPRTSVGSTGVESAASLASPRVTSLPASSRSWKRWVRVFSGWSGSVTVMIRPSVSDAGSTGRSTTTSPTWMRGSIEPDMITRGDQPRAAGSTDQTTRESTTARAAREPATSSTLDQPGSPAGAAEADAGPEAGRC